MGDPFRTLAGPALPTRPELTRWQRVLVRALGDRCRAWRWYRAHVGGRWCRGSTVFPPRRDGWRWRHMEHGECPVRHYAPAAVVCGCSRTTCRCEVYPYGSLFEPPHVANDVAAHARADIKWRRSLGEKIVWRDA